MRVGLDRVMYRHPRERGRQLPEAIPRPRDLEPQVGGGRLPGGEGPDHAPASRGLHAVPGHVGDGLADREPEPYPAGQRPGQPRGARHAPGTDQEPVQCFRGRARRQLLCHSVPCSGGQPAESGQVGRGPAGRGRRLHPDAPVEPDALAKRGQARGGQQRSGSQVPGGETAGSRERAAHLGQPEPGPPRLPPPGPRVRGTHRRISGRQRLPGLCAPGRKRHSRGLVNAHIAPPGIPGFPARCEVPL